MQTVLGLLWAGALHLSVLSATPAQTAVAATALPAASLHDAGTATATTAASQHANTQQAAAAAPLSWAQAFAALWLAGVLLGALRSGYAYRASRRLVQASAPCAAALLGALRLAAEAHGPAPTAAAAAVRADRFAAADRAVAAGAAAGAVPGGDARQRSGYGLDPRTGAPAAPRPVVGPGRRWRNICSSSTAVRLAVRE